MASQSIREAAKNGDAAAIATILNTNLNPQLVQVEVGWQEECLQIRLQALTVPSQNSAAMIQDWLGSLESQVIHKVKVDGFRVNSDRPDWQHEFELIPPLQTAEPEDAPTIEPPSSLPNQRYQLKEMQPEDEPNPLPPEANRGNFGWGVVILAAGLGLGLSLMTIGFIVAVLAYFLFGRNSSLGGLVGLLFFMALYVIAPATLIAGIVTMFWTPGRPGQPVRIKPLQAKPVAIRQGGTVTAPPLATSSRNLYINQAIRYGIVIFTAGLLIDALLCFAQNMAVSTHDYANDNLAFKIPLHRTRPSVMELLQPFLLGGCSRGNAIILQPFLLIVYLAHAIKNTAVAPAIRVAASICCLLTPPISIPIYCYLFLWRDRPPTWAQKSRS